MIEIINEIHIDSYLAHASWWWGDMGMTELYNFFKFKFPIDYVNLGMFFHTL